MSYRKPGQRVSGRFVILTVLLVGVLALFRLYTYYKDAAAPIPPGVTLGGIDLSSYKDRAEIREQLEPIFTQPIGVHFENQLLVLDPAQIGFTVHVDATIDDAARYLEGIDFVDIAVREAIGLPQRQRDVPVRYSYDEAALRKWLEGVAAQWNYDPIPARVDVPPVAAPIAAASAVTATTTVTDGLAQLDGATGVVPVLFLPPCLSPRRRRSPSASSTGCPAHQGRSSTSRRAFPSCWRRWPPPTNAWPSLC